MGELLGVQPPQHVPFPLVGPPREQEAECAFDPKVEFRAPPPRQAFAHSLALRSIERVPLSCPADEAVGEAMCELVEDNIGVESRVPPRVEAQATAGSINEH